MDNKTLPNGFITVEEAVKLINSDTRDNAVVDTQWLVSRIDWIEEAHNFRIPLVRTATKEEVLDFMKKNPGRRHSGLIKQGSKYVTIYTSYEKELLKKAIRDHYREMAGRDFVEEKTRGVTAVIDEGGTNSERPRRMKKTVANEGDTIGTGESRVTNSESGAGL